jgi:GAF domain-containing protein
MATGGRKATKRTTAPKRTRSVRKSKSGRPKSAPAKSAPAKSGASKSAPPKSGKRASGKTESETAALKSQLRTAQDRQTASAEILRTIGSVSGDAERSLYEIAEITKRLFEASSVSIFVAEGDKWGQIVHDGASSKRIGAEVPVDQLRIGGHSLPGATFSENRQIHLPDLNHVDPAIADWPGLRPSRAAGTRTLSGTPLRRAGHAIGVLIVHRDRLAPFADDELVLLQSFADQAAIAIHNARLFNETQEALERQTATADILKVIASSPDNVQPVFDAIVASAARLVGAFSVSVYRFADGIVHLVAFISTNPAGDQALRDLFPRPVADLDHFSVAQSGRLLQISDTEDQPQGRLRDLARARGFRSVMHAPLINRETSIGLIAVTRKNPGPFTAHHIQLLQSFADQAVIAIENARLFNETQEALEQQTAISDVLRVISSSPGDVGPVFASVAEHAARICEAQIVDILIIVDGRLQYAAEFGEFGRLQPGETAPLNRDSVMGRSICDKQPVHVVDLQSMDHDFPLGREYAFALGHRTTLAVPLIREDCALGTILVRRTEVRPFDDRHVALLKTFADQAAIAIENARLINETQQALERQTATADILNVIASSPDDVQPVFEAIAERSNELIRGFSTSVFSIVDEMMHLSAFTRTNPAADEALKARFPSPLSARTWAEQIRNGHIVQIPDTEVEGAVSTDLRDSARMRGYRSMLHVPLLRERTTIGLISVTRVEPGPFPSNHVQLLQTFADQAVIAIGNVQLFDEVQAKTADLQESLQQQTATAEVLKVISASPGELKPVFRAMVENATRLCEAEFGNLFILEGDVFHIGAAHSPPSAYAELRQRGKAIVLRDNPGIPLARIVETKSIVHIADFTAEQSYIDRNPAIVGLVEIAGARTFLSVPMLKDNEVIGAINIYRQEVRPFNDKQIELVQNFASQAVIAIENTRLLNELKQRTADLSKSLDDLRAAQDRLVQTEKLASLGQLTAGIAHEIKNPLNFVNNFSALSAELTDELNDALKPVALDNKVRKEVDELTAMLKDNLEKVVQHGKRADSIVKNMLLHSRESSGERRPADVNALLDESLNLAYHGARAEKSGFNITLQRDFDADAGEVELFPQEITRALLNVISNGFYAATRRKAENNDSGFEPVLAAATRNLGDRVEIRIRDNGTGIPAEVREKMFNPFFTTKPAGEGTGLGLSMSHDIIVKQHGGSIDIATEAGEFTELRIVLPRGGRR